MFKYERNSNVFETIDTEEKAYWLGFLYADGYVNEKDNLIIVGLKHEDKEHIVKFQSFFQTNAPYVDKVNNGGRPYCFFRLYDKKMVKDLYTQGLYNKKSLTLEPNFNMPSELIIHWTRGLFDGDGSIYPHTSPRAHERYYIGLVGTESILKYTQQVWGVQRKLDYNRSVPKFTICRKEEVNRILHLLYDNSNIFLDRKKNLAYKAIEINLQ